MTDNFEPGTWQEYLHPAPYTTTSRRTRHAISHKIFAGKPATILRVGAPTHSKISHTKISHTKPLGVRSAPRGSDPAPESLPVIHPVIHRKHRKKKHTPVVNRAPASSRVVHPKIKPGQINQHGVFIGDVSEAYKGLSWKRSGLPMDITKQDVERWKVTHAKMIMSSARVVGMHEKDEVWPMLWLRAKLMKKFLPGNRPLVHQGARNAVPVVHAFGKAPVRVTGPCPRAGCVETPEDELYAAILSSARGHSIWRKVVAIAIKRGVY